MQRKGICIMLRINRRASIILSIIFTVLFLAALLLLSVFMPTFINLVLSATLDRGIRPLLFAIDKNVLVFLGYMIIVLMACAVVLMDILLLRVMAGAVFTDKSVALIRYVSWCCIGIGVLFGVVGMHFMVSLLVACAALFLGLCLRVVKNVIEEAIAIKAENDLTV